MIPLHPNGFEYPIREISIEIIQNIRFNSLTRRTIIVNESYFTTDRGNIYFTKPLEDIILEKYPNFADLVEQNFKLYYQVHISFDIFIPDTSAETHGLALAQATFYTIMDYFNQYTYAQTTANMISEITYTETMTFWSTVISAPLVYLGSYLASGKTSALSGAKLVKMILSPVKETYEEIVIEGLSKLM